MAEKSHEARRKRKALASQLPVNQATTPPSGQLIQPAAIIAPPCADSPEAIRARAQLEAANNRLQTALDDNETLPIDIERLTRSVTSLRESVRILSGIPLPGSHKPMPQRAGRRSSYDVAEPADPAA